MAMPLRYTDVIIWLALTTVLYLVGLGVYRLYLSPIAKIPGPKLAALTRYYELYFDAKSQRFPWEINRLHDVYGPIVRIAPNEVHVKDRDFLDEIFTGPKRPREKSKFFIGEGVTGSFATIGHELHRIRRSALDPFFSKRSILALEAVIQENVNKLCNNFDKYANTDAILELRLAYTSLTLDTISQYCYGESYGVMDDPKAAKAWKDAVSATFESLWLPRHFPWIRTILETLPVSWVMKMNETTGFFVKFGRDMKMEAERIIAQRAKGSAKKNTHRTVFTELLDSDLPPAEKSVKRLTDEGITLIAAGTDTTSLTLSNITFRLLDSPKVLDQLQIELDEAIPDPSTSVSWNKLEQLPFLKGVINEGLRTSNLSMARFDRSAPSETIHYKGYAIPPGIDFSMTTSFLNMDPDWAPDPERFDPSRWIGDENGNTAIDKAGFVPFGRGTRNCLGINLAYAELYLTVANVFRKFKLELFETDFSDIEVVQDALVGYPRKSSKGIRVKVSRR